MFEAMKTTYKEMYRDYMMALKNGDADVEAKKSMVDGYGKALADVAVYMMSGVTATKARAFVANINSSIEKEFAK